MKSFLKEKKKEFISKYGLLFFFFIIILNRLFILFSKIYYLLIKKTSILSFLYIFNRRIHCGIR